MLDIKVDREKYLKSSFIEESPFINEFFIKELNLSNYRKYTDEIIEIKSQFTLLVGENAT